MKYTWPHENIYNDLDGMDGDQFGNRLKSRGSRAMTWDEFKTTIDGKLDQLIVQEVCAVDIEIKSIDFDSLRYDPETIFVGFSDDGDLEIYN